MSANDRRPAVEDPEADGFLSRWSRRKSEARQGRAEPEAPSADLPAGTAAPEPAADADEVDEVDVEALEKLDIDKLDFDFDFTVFMKKGVPQALRNRALRRLWRSNPVLANVDGLNDYDEDFNLTGKMMDKFESAYKIGRGYLPDPADEAPARAAADETPEAKTAEQSETGEADAGIAGTDEQGPSPGSDERTG